MKKKISSYLEKLVLRYKEILEFTDKQNRAIIQQRQEVLEDIIKKREKINQQTAKLEKLIIDTIGDKTVDLTGFSEYQQLAELVEKIEKKDRLNQKMLQDLLADMKIESEEIRKRKKLAAKYNIMNRRIIPEHFDRKSD